MRKIYTDYLNDYMDRCGPFQLDPDQLGDLFKAELFITGCRLTDSKLSVPDAWSIMSGYDYPVIPKRARLDFIYRLRILFPHIRSKKSLNRMLHQYSTIPHNHRLYQQTDNKEWGNTGSKRFHNRVKFYTSILEHPIEHKSFAYTFATSSKFSYSRRKPDGESISYNGELPELPVSTPTFPSYRSKGNFESKRLSNDIVGFKLTSLKSPPQTSFSYTGIQHIVGGLGAGKTSFMLQETVHLVQEHGARIGFVESSVAQVLKRVYQLQSKGINAVPIIGRSNRKKHLQSFLASHHHRISNVTDWTKDDHAGLQHLSEICFIQALTDDETESGDYPCKRLKQEDKTCLCPYASQCGIYRDFASLIEADVWVATSASVLQTRLPPMLDPAERTIYEAMYDLLDIVYVDEADEVQKQFDSTFLTDIALFGDSNQLFEKVYIESVRRTAGRYQYAGDSMIQSWINNLSRLEQTIRSGIYHKLHYSPEFARHLKGKMVRLSTYAYHLSEWFGVSEEEQQIIFQDLMDYSNQVTGHWLEEYTDSLLSIENPEDQIALLNRLLAKWGTSGQASKRKYNYDWLSFYLLLVSTDHCLKHFFEMYPIIQNKLGVLTESDILLSLHREFSPFLPESMTGPLTGFHYDIKDGKKTGTFRVAEYTGIGRHLLYNWPRLYQQSDQKSGPAVILLSGTSYAPDSEHYHVDVPVHWLLESDKPLPRITQEYYPVYNPADMTKAIAISGQDEETRSRHLETMTLQLLSKFEWELKEWKHAGTNRKVLIIVNSYADVEDVHRALQRTSEWRNRYRKLTRSLKSNNTEDFSRAELERFLDEDADILIAPMLAISRGYNILDESNSSLFGSVFFLIRPYPIPHDLTYLVQILHGNLPKYLIQLEKEELVYAEAVTRLRSKSNKLFHLLYHKPDYWMILKPEERTTIGWYTFVPVWQTIGRLLRNGTDARVFFCDAKFRARPNDEKGQSMLEVWEDMLAQYQKEKVTISLYGSFMQSPILNLRGE
ncbi:hypothetical protein SAMN05444162_3067 [Paenibacillaceae bacterium GAS479]|nr:hypothetical protein SAMN05444162_3067 [Paenibacillaceae bacterium GAS479]